VRAIVLVPILALLAACAPAGPATAPPTALPGATAATTATSGPGATPAPTDPTGTATSPSEAVPSPSPSGAIALVTGDEARDGDFRLTMEVGAATYPAGEPIVAGATLTYLGPSPTATAWGSGSGLVTIALEQLDGPLDPGGAGQDDCRGYDFVWGVPQVIPYEKSGGWSADDPNAAWYSTFFKDPVLRLPAGTWRLTARLDATIGDTCSADTGRHELATSVTFQVVD
jgi:hypothetical protein